MAGDSDGDGLAELRVRLRRKRPWPPSESANVARVAVVREAGVQLGGSSSSSSSVPEVAVGAALPEAPAGPAVDDPAEPPDTAGGQDRAELVRAFSAAAQPSEESRRLYKKLWMRMSRTMTEISAKGELAPAEVAFRDVPGALVAEERMAAWLRLVDAAEPLARIGGAPRRRFGRPSIGNVPGLQSPRWLRESTALLT